VFHLLNFKRANFENSSAVQVTGLTSSTSSQGPLIEFAVWSIPKSNSTIISPSPKFVILKNANLLISKGAKVNTKNKFGYTPLDMAIKLNKAKIADLLRKHGGKTKKELEAAGN